MTKKRIFGLDPNRLNKLLSLGTENLAGSDIEDEESPKTGEDALAKTIDASHFTVSLDILAEQPGSRIGRYKLLSILGEGGMGIVYLAEQNEPIKRRVALKVIKPGMDSKRVIARFEAERQVLALLDHPNIAHVHDAGMTENGRPYFVMELVKGLTITEHCDRHKLTIEARLHLFGQVCLAVHHAHQKGIIHRDIKPSNILISTHDDQAVPKIIDFGVAKAIAQPLTEQTLVTEQGQLFGTPEYMSPEQADMANEDIDTRSDIYSLGVLLYVLLTGVLPFDLDTLREGGVEHIRQVIRESDPKTPSTRLSSLGEEAQKVAEKRRTEVAALTKCLHKELEWIPLKAMRKERTERYRSASELADDIDNYLKGAPLIAGPESTLYQIKKFVRRRRALVMGIAAVLAVLIAGIVVSMIFAIGQARALAESQAIADFLKNDVLASVGPGKTKGKDVTVRYVLDIASENLEGRFKDQPLVEASIRSTLGQTYRQLGETSKAEKHCQRAIQIYRLYLDQGYPDLLWTMDRLGWIYWDQGQYAEMENLFTRTLQISQGVSNLEQTLLAMNGLAYSYWYLGRYKDAELLYNRISHIAQSDPGERQVLLYCKCNLAAVYGHQGRYEEAERLFVQTLKAAKWAEEGSHWEFYHRSKMADMYRDQGRYDRAEPIFVKTLETQRLLLGNNHLHTLLSMYGLARLYTAQDRYNKADDLYTEMLGIVPGQLGEEHPETLGFMNGFAVLLTKQKRYDEAEPLFKKALEGRRQKLYEDHPATLETKNDLAVLYKEQERYDDAEPLLIQAVEGRRLKLGDTHPHTLESWNNLIDLYEAWNKLDKAEEWRAKLPQTEAVTE
jgi:serine/threonine protein kinase/Flp pilus assembly protein TadD